MSMLHGLPLQSVLNALDEGVVILDDNGVILAVNHRVFDILRKDFSTDVVGKHIGDTVSLHSDLDGLDGSERDKVAHARTKLLVGGYHEGGEFSERSVLRDGRKIELRRSVPEAGFAILTLRDVTADEELERKSAQLETVVQNTDDGVFQIDGDGLIELFNTRMASMYRFEDAGIRIGDHVSKFVSYLIKNTEMDETALATFKTIDSDNSGLTLPLIRQQTIKTNWGRVFEVSRVGLPGGGILATHRDVTALHQRQMLLEHARLEAEDTSRLKSEFIARVTHELRTPMHGVLGIAALLERSGLNDNQLRFLDTLQRSGRHMVDLIDGLLTISTIETGDIVIETHRANLDLLIEDTFTLLRPIADEKNLSFECDCNFAVREALADGTRLTQIVVNLLTNALKFTEDGEVRLRAETIPQAECLLLRVEVSDTGVGIPQGKLTQIFDKFTQLRGVRGVCSEGVGLGLSITQSLTELMGGRMSVTSTEGAGSVFTVEIPLEYASAEFRAQHGCDLSPVTLPRQSHPLRQ